MSADTSLLLELNISPLWIKTLWAGRMEWGCVLGGGACCLPQGSGWYGGDKYFLLVSRQYPRFSICLEFPNSLLCIQFLLDTKLATTDISHSTSSPVNPVPSLLIAILACPVFLTLDINILYPVCHDEVWKLLLTPSSPYLSTNLQLVSCLILLTPSLKYL